MAVPPKLCPVCGQAVIGRSHNAKYCSKVCFARETNTKRKHGISHVEYDRMLDLQGGVCAICKSNKSGSRWESFNIDHDHETGQIRGLLCSSCNMGLGMFRDRADLLIEAAKYLGG